MGIHIEKDNVPFLNSLVSNPQTADNSNHAFYRGLRKGQGGGGQRTESDLGYMGQEGRNYCLK